MTIEGILKRELIAPDVEAATQAELFAYAAEKLIALGYVSPGYDEKLMQREEHFPTGLATKSMDVAIPHTDSHVVQESFIFVLKVNGAVPFHQMGTFPQDNVLVYPRMVFILGFVKDELQLEILQALMGLFNEVAIMEQLAEIEDAGQLFNTLRQQLARIT